jgi:DNA-binding protein HU-beta
MKPVEIKNLFAELAKSELQSKGYITIVGLGRLELRDRAARTAINPRTKESVQVPARKVLGIRTSPSFIQKDL